MADDKNLGEELDDMLDGAKDSAKKAAGKASELAGDAKEKASEFADDAKEKASEFADDAKEAASEFADDAKQVLSDGKNVAIIAHITLIGWIIALVMNNGNKSEIGSFYIRQMLGLMLCAIVLSFIPVVGWILNLLMLVLWVVSLIGSFSGEKKLTPGIGQYFQDWFKGI